MYSGVTKKCVMKIVRHHSIVYMSINGYPSIDKMTMLLLYWLIIFTFTVDFSFKSLLTALKEEKRIEIEKTHSLRYRIWHILFNNFTKLRCRQND